MTAAYDYFSTSRATQLAAPVDATAANVTVLDGSTYPDPALTGKQYTLLLAYGSDREEVCTVTGKPSASSFTVVRGQDGTPATPKNTGDTVVHGVSARDFNRVTALDASLDVAQADIDALEAADVALSGRISAIETTMPGKVNDTGDTLTGPLAMSGNKITGLPAAAATDEPVTLGQGDGRYMTPAQGDAKYMTAVQADAKYVDVAGDTMTGPLTVDRVATSGDTVVIRQDAYPTLRFIKDLGAANQKHWNIYISGPTGESGPSASSLTFLAEADDLADQATIRMYRDGHMVLGADGVGSMDAVTMRQVQKYSAYLARTTDTALTDGTNYNIVWETWTSPNGNSASHDSMTVGSTGATISKAGMYIVSARVAFTGTSAGRVQTNLTRDGVAMRTDLRPFSIGNTNQALVTGLVDGTAGDKLSVSVAPFGSIGSARLAAAYLDIVGPI